MNAITSQDPESLSLSLSRLVAPRSPIQFIAACSHNGLAVKCNQLRLIRSHFPNYEYKWSQLELELEREL